LDRHVLIYLLHHKTISALSENNFRISFFNPSFLFLKSPFQMKKLPREILVLIFENLHLSFKLECMLVCHEWANVLRSTCLYDTIVISKTSIFVRFVQYLEEQAHIREQVKELVLLGSLNIGMHEIQFDRLFFNLRSLHFGPGIYITDLGNPQNRSMSLKHCSNQIQTVKLYNNSLFMYALFTSSVFPSLTTLSTNGWYFGIGFIKHLAAAPNLENITVIDLEVSTSLLENLHATVPALQSLELIEARLRPGNNTDQINSANSMKAVHINFINGYFHIMMYWLQYISIKYTNISMLSFVCSGILSERVADRLTAAESSILPVLEKLCHLKRFKTCFPASIATLFSDIEISNSKIEELSLFANYGNTRRPIMIASEYYRLITELILKIDSSEWLYILQHMKFIKKLEVYSHESHNTLDLSELIKQCPAPMESLMVKGFSVVCQNQSYQNHQLIKLGINHSDVSHEVYSYISNFFPNLQHLELESSLSKNEIIMLNKLMLYSLRLTRKLHQLPYLVTTLDDNKTHLYLVPHVAKSFVKYNNTDTYDVIKPSSTPTQETENSIHFFFGSIKILFINNHLAY
jgi:hypothetical protein